MRFLLVLAATFAADAAVAGTLEIAPVRTTEWKAVYGQVEARDLVPARARIGGTVVQFMVGEGDAVESGQKIAIIRDFCSESCWMLRSDACSRSCRSCCWPSR